MILPWKLFSHKMELIHYSLNLYKPPFTLSVPGQGVFVIFPFMCFSKLASNIFFYRLFENEYSSKVFEQNKVKSQHSKHQKVLHLFSQGVSISVSLFISSLNCGRSIKKISCGQKLYLLCANISCNSRTIWWNLYSIYIQQNIQPLCSYSIDLCGTCWLYFTVHTNNPSI